jgi:hypothetical protein
MTGLHLGREGLRMRRMPASCGKPVGLARVAPDARADDVLPRGLAAVVARDHVVQVELLAREDPRAVLAGVLVSLEHVVAGQLKLLARQLVEEREEDHAGQANRPGGRVDRLKLGDGRVVLREVDPVHHREHPEVVLLLVDNMGVAAGQEPEGATGANHVNRLPKAVKDKHRLIKGSLHAESRDRDLAPRLSSGRLRSQGCRVNRAIPVP